MADFDIAFARTLKFEGGYSNNPDDNGNWTGGKKGVGNLVGTNMGITAPDMVLYLKRTPTVSDMKNMPVDVAKYIYKLHYWLPVRGDEINNQDEANMIYDTAVNMGVYMAIKLTQQSLELKPTGIMGDETINKLNSK